MGLALTAPVATANGKIDGEPIFQAVRDEFVSGTRAGALETFKLSHEVALLKEPRPRLTVRARADDPPQEVPLSQWTFVDRRSIKLNDGVKPKPGNLTSSAMSPVIPRCRGLVSLPPAMS